MLTIVENYEIYQRRTVEQTPIRRFANEMVKEFMKIAKPGEVYEVTGAPQEGITDNQKKAAQLSQALKTEIRQQGRSNDIDVFQRNRRVFMERKRPRTSSPKPNPYPYD